MNLRYILKEDQANNFQQETICLFGCENESFPPLGNEPQLQVIVSQLAVELGPSWNGVALPSLFEERTLQKSSEPRELTIEMLGFA